MALIDADASGLEVVCAAYLSQDKVLIDELVSGIEIHEANQKAFNLPDALTAKVLKFRILYGSSEFAFANDPSFTHVSTQPKYWKRVIEDYYSKYSGIAKWHKQMLTEVMSTGRYVSPVGRIYEYAPSKDSYGRFGWPRTTILNYPVQGLGADLMSIARVSAYRRLSSQFNQFAEGKIKLVNTVHDSILVDTTTDLTYNVCSCLDQVFKDIPKNFEKFFGKPFNVPMKSKIKYGPNWGNMVRWTK